MNIINTVKLLFFPKALARAQVKETERRAAEGNRNTRGPDEWFEKTLRRVAKKRRGMAMSLVLVAAASVLGLIVAEYINASYRVTLDDLRYIRLLAIVVVGSAVLGRIGYETPTLGGNSLLERTSEGAFKIFYLLGITITTIVLFLEPSSGSLVQPMPDAAN